MMTTDPNTLNALTNNGGGGNAVAPTPPPTADPINNSGGGNTPTDYYSDYVVDFDEPSQPIVSMPLVDNTPLDYGDYVVDFDEPSQPIVSMPLVDNTPLDYGDYVVDFDEPSQPIVSMPLVDNTQTEDIDFTGFEFEPSEPIVSTPVVNNGGSNGGGVATVPAPVSPSPSISSSGNLLQIGASTKGIGINAVSKINDGKAYEIAIFAVDDLSGKIGGIDPSNRTAYLNAAINAAQTIASPLNGNFFSQDRKEIGLDSAKIYEFIAIKDGSLAEAKQQIGKGQAVNNIQFSLPDANGNSPIKVTSNSNGQTVSIDNDALVLNITNLTGATPIKPIGTKSQSLAEGRTIDLTDNTGSNLRVDTIAKGDAAYASQFGFYAVENASGAIRIASGELISVTDPRYAAEAVKSALTNSIQTSKNESYSDRSIDSGKIFAPVLISQGTLNSFLQNNASNAGGANVVHAYFNYLGANPDKVDHFRLIGDNHFGVEDMYGGGDRDFNDLTIKMNVKAV
jgi:hypothetical protein